MTYYKPEVQGKSISWRVMPLRYNKRQLLQVPRMGNVNSKCLLNLLGHIKIIYRFSSWFAKNHDWNQTVIHMFRASKMFWIFCIPYPIFFFYSVLLIKCRKKFNCTQFIILVSREIIFRLLWKQILFKLLQCWIRMQS